MIGEFAWLLLKVANHIYINYPDPKKPGPRKTRTLKNLDPKKHGINRRLKCMSDFRGLCFIETMRNVIYCLKVHVLIDT